jgi:DNA modification methylase
MPESIQLIHGDARKIPLPDASVQCIVTSPPYWGLRKYAGEQDVVWANGTRTQGIVRCNNGDHDWVDESIEITEAVGNWQQAENGTGLKSGVSQTRFKGDVKAANAKRSTSIPRGTCTLCGAWRGGYGLEPTIEMYIAHSVEILRELRRVLRPDGVLFWNLGDSYSAMKGYSGALKPSDMQSSNRGSLRGKDSFLPQRNPQSGLKPKDLCLIPERIALAAQADGWWVRSRIIWAKPNPMPESVTDRPTDALEHIWMFTRSERYFWDADAVREVTGRETPPEEYANGDGHNVPSGTLEQGVNAGFGSKKTRFTNPGGRNMRNVWTFSTQPYPEAHFATFPEELPRRCILAATSQKGACAQCGAPWERVTRRKFYGDWNPHPGSNAATVVNGQTADRKGEAFAESWTPPQTLGWTPTCRCRSQHGKTVDCLVLDPFGGSGTTGRVALELGRRAVLVDIAYNAEYRALAEKRTRNVEVELPFL